MRKILCLDYDMTLFDHEINQIPRSALDAIDSVRKDYKIVLATGRFFNDVRNKPLKDAVNPDAVIHSNGSVIEVDNNIIHESFLERELMKKVIQFAIANDISLGGLYQGNFYNTNPKKLKERWNSMGKNYDHYEIYDAKELFDKKMYSLFLYDTVDAALLIEENFKELRAPIMSEKTGGADVIPYHLSKAFGMKILLEHWNQTEKDVIAIGDSMNDYELIKMASVGIAMGNAVDKLKEIADFVTTPISEDGIKNAIYYLKNNISDSL